MLRRPVKAHRHTYTHQHHAQNGRLSRLASRTQTTIAVRADRPFVDDDERGRRATRCIVHQVYKDEDLQEHGFADRTPVYDPICGTGRPRYRGALSRCVPGDAVRSVILILIVPVIVNVTVTVVVTDSLTMVHRGIILSLVWCLLSYPACFSAEKLAPDQQAPLFARGSGGLILKPPFEGPSAAASPAISTNVINEDGVEREETASFKVVDGELVRVVEGHFSYKSPEGIPVSVNYVADENGNRAGFRLGAAALGITPSRINVAVPKPRVLGPGGGTTYLPPKSPSSNVDRSYLPPH
ncbi:uncharacterized protein LOC116846940 [Odontomachus brunneus]|uniref:uncharacterized protein LOC116846940 n=1 Tax=Odontomachus brunneus TaxID=486640 RepID=UPI0013F19D9E|nr:uncharacterized protein LOC116846940 [Odontomachus brunneus]